MTATDLAVPLRQALTDAGYTYDGVVGLLGAEAHAALGRNETTPALRRTTDRSALSTLVRLWLLQRPVPLADAEAALPGLVDRLCVAGVLERSVSEVAARLDVRPYAAPTADPTVGPDRDDGTGDLWVVSDLTPGLDGAPNHVSPDHVLGVSSASTSLARLTVREPVASALDLGTGCGVQALHLAGHAGRVVATDVNRRALRVAGLTAALNGVDVELREGSFFEAVRGQTFDLVATNPPFVISPALSAAAGWGERLVYRDSGLPGDRVVEHIVRGLPDHLAPGGWGQVLANWVVTRGQAWDERLAGWLDDRCDALVVQREVVDTPSYVELWLRDAGLHTGPDYVRRYNTWLAWFDEQGVEAVGFGWVSLHRTDPSTPTHDLLDWPFDIEQPIAPAVAAWGRSVGTRVDADSRLVLAEGVRQETVGAPGADDPETIVLRQQRGLRRARRVDTVEAALVGACDGDLSVGQLLDAVSELLGREPEATRSTYLPVVAELVAEGYLSPRPGMSPADQALP